MLMKSRQNEFLTPNGGKQGRWFVLELRHTDVFLLERLKLDKVSTLYWSDSFE